MEHFSSNFSPMINGENGRIFIPACQPVNQSGPEGTMVGGESNPPATAAAAAGGTRRNPWGNLSYADLITQAITQAPDQRLTLAQIYEWLIKNIPHFREKSDSISSTGWKVKGLTILLLISVKGS